LEKENMKVVETMIEVIHCRGTHSETPRWMKVAQGGAQCRTFMFYCTSYVLNSDGIK
jgi:hypothetical protein